MKALRLSLAASVLIANPFAPAGAQDLAAAAAFLDKRFKQLDTRTRTRMASSPWMKCARISAIRSPR
jgi:hypothetical protein